MLELLAFSTCAYLTLFLSDIPGESVQTSGTLKELLVSPVPKQCKNWWVSNLIMGKKWNRRKVILASFPGSSEHVQPLTPVTPSGVKGCTSTLDHSRLEPEDEARETSTGKGGSALRRNVI